MDPFGKASDAKLREVAAKVGLGGDGLLDTDVGTVGPSYLKEATAAIAHSDESAQSSLREHGYYKSRMIERMRDAGVCPGQLWVHVHAGWVALTLTLTCMYVTLTCNTNAN